jgi:hypothetical protein
MTADIDPAFADRCAATAIGLRELAALGARSDADEAAVGRAAYLTAELLTDPEALLAVALVIEQQRAGVADKEQAAPPMLGGAWTGDNWILCGCAGPRGTCATVNCTNHPGAP